MNIFDTEEQLVVNKATSGENLKDFDKDDIMRRFDFVLAINNDNEIHNLYDGLKQKFATITSADWERIKSLLPFNIPYSDEDLAVS